MRVNVYTEELEYSIQPNRRAQIVEATYVSSRTGKEMTNYGLRIFLRSAPELHDSTHDDDRSAVTFWCGGNRDNVFAFLDEIKGAIA